jgi:hypothetical protein
VNRESRLVLLSVAFEVCRHADRSHIKISRRHPVLISELNPALASTKMGDSVSVVQGYVVARNKDIAPSRAAYWESFCKTPVDLLPDVSHGHSPKPMVVIHLHIEVSLSIGWATPEVILRPVLNPGDWGRNIS